MRKLRLALPLLALVSVGGCQTGTGTGALGAEVLLHLVEDVGHGAPSGGGAGRAGIAARCRAVNSPLTKSVIVLGARRCRAA